MNDIKIISIKDIDPFNNHPFKVIEDESLKTLAESIKENGLLNPVIVRKKDNDRYEMISGHRRLKAIELNGEDFIKCEVKELSDDEATIFMVDSNMYRDKILPSEKAFAYKMKLDSLKHQGKKTSRTEFGKSESAGEISEESARTVQKYIRLTYLIPELLKVVDDSFGAKDHHKITMGIKPAVELSYLNKDEQMLVYSEMTYDDLSPSHAQAIRIRKLSKEKKLNAESLEEILSEKKGNQNDRISFNKEKIENVLPYELTKRDKRYIEQYIIKAIETYKKLELERGDAYDLD